MTRLPVLLLVLAISVASAKPVVTNWNELRCTFDVGNCYRRTVIAIRKTTSYDEYVFIRGGAYSTEKPIPVRHRAVPEKAGSYYGAMSQNDLELSWDGAEKGQGTYHGESANGTPLMWTTNTINYHQRALEDGVGFHPLNTMGPHYWLVDLDMDCSKLGKDGLFEFKGFLVNRRWNWNYWELSNVFRKKCDDNEVRSRHGNHVGQCGMMNIVEFNGWGCDMIKSIPE